MPIVVMTQRCWRSRNLTVSDVRGEHEYSERRP
jgi:hypothetical protein